MAASRLPAEPLQAELRRARPDWMSWKAFAVRLGVSSRTLARVMAATDLAPEWADRLALRLGLHPAIVWPEEWGAVVSAMDGETASVGGDRSRRSSEEAAGPPRRGRLAGRSRRPRGEAGSRGAGQRAGGRQSL